ncbi:GntR family transcriptional regulator/MocR family aminotransferase [Mycolicibacterium fluoranthenivorans]|uniref:GntR family transcriptional regulator/MocR family aminotransferase n=1 Tax=Mycolicibacterium fluoranthenivorans TaxID=258505 RepID=A0A7X5TZT6_9MYCO|nr:PLP-dependent aminotransferase family protein [Mycolicibacterium fluoranthenivorans]MCV7358116.1 PLP-dependent aminotransferase family protein [Mycolicibacterium fluoranthenivorans]NIH95764.1 GntR family transcriptional regulator/MocR family aminotransferase [Mycolicibacterium fluoranthenivorans]
MSRSNPDVSQRTNSSAGFSPELLIHLNRSQRVVREQLAQQLRAMIRDGRLPAGARLPPTRVMARDLDVARSVVVDAYQQLIADGYLSARQGSGTRVLPVSSDRPAVDSRSAEVTSAIGLFAGLPDPALFPRAEWLRHYRTALQALPDGRLGYPGPAGVQELRDALADYLSRVRGVAAAPENILVCSGITQAITLICRALHARGVRTIAMEDPGFGLHRQAIINAGLNVTGVPVDDDGLHVNALDNLDVGALLTAPAHSYPTGAVLSTPRRTALLRWARQRNMVIIEDDYDAEFRYDSAPLGALQGLAPEHVVYTGCVSKTLTPALRLGWMVLPRWLTGAVVHQKLLDDTGTSVLEQRALARFIETGGLTRHLRRVRPIYRHRRDAAVQATATALPGAAVKGIDAGLHLYVELPQWCDEADLLTAARERGIVIEGASWHFHSPAVAPPALIIGYGSTTEATVGDALTRLGEVYGSARAGSV